MINFNDLKKHKKNELNILHSDKFKLSKYYDIFEIENILIGENIEYIIKNYNKKIDESEIKIYFNIQNKNYITNNIYYSDNLIFIYMSNFFKKNILEKIENKYNLDSNTLHIIQILYVKKNIKNNKDENNYNDKIINYDNYNCDFMILINLNENNNEIINFLEISNFNSKIKKNNGIVFCKKHKIDFNENIENILLITVNYLDGYNLFEYNRHPNEFV